MTGIAPIALALLTATSALADELTRLADAFVRAEGDEARVAALEALAACEPASPQDAPLVAEAVAAGLGDDALPVRVRAAELLVELDREVAVTQLTTAAGALAGKERDLLASLDQVLGSEWRAVNSLDGPRASAEHRRASLGLAELRGALARSLGALPDDRSVEALGGLLEVLGEVDPAREHGVLESLGKAQGGSGAENDLRSQAELFAPHHASGAEPVAVALVDLGSRPAMELLIGYWELIEERRDRWETFHENARRARPRPRPKKEDSSREWKRREKARLAQLTEVCGNRVESLESQAARVHAHLRSVATERGLAAVPKKPLPAKAWRAWLTRTAADLPVELSPAAGR